MPTYTPIRCGVILSMFLCVILVVERSLPAQPPETRPNDTQMDLQRELENLKERQSLLVEAAEKDLGRSYVIFSVAAAFFAVFAGFLAIRQLIQEQQRAAEEQRRFGLEQQHFSEVQSVMTTFRDNIVTVNSLINTVAQTFSMQKDMHESLDIFDSRIEQLDAFKASEEHKYRSELDALNNRSVQFFIDCQLHKKDREAFKHEDNKMRLESFAAHFDTLQRTGESSGLLSPISLLVRALAHFNSTQYPETANLLKNSREFAQKQLDAPLSQYGTWDSDEVRHNLLVLIAETGYHLGIIHYNLGDFENARKEFTTAFEKNSLDFRSRIYIPELMFFDQGIDPAGTEKEYNLVEQELNNLRVEDRRRMNPRWESHLASLKMRQGNFYLPKLIPLESRGKWKQFENAETAIQCFWAAKDSAPESAFVNFSLAQGMYALGRSTLWKKETPDDLFRKVFYTFRNEAILKTEPILLTLFHYCSAIACWLGRIERESPTMYLGQARQHLQRVPQQIRIFSPINKINMTRRELLAEMESFEKTF